MSQRQGCRRHALPRCRTCTLHVEACVCSTIAPVATATRLVIVQHWQERKKVTNTARLLERLVTPSRMLTQGAPDRRLDSHTIFAAEDEALLLFPQSDAVPLDQLPPPDPRRPRTLAILDGTWAQARTMARKLPGLNQATRVVLPAGVPPAAWRLRKPLVESYLCTCEAALRALEILEGRERIAPALATFHAVVTALAVMRGVPLPRALP